VEFRHRSVHLREEFLMTEPRTVEKRKADVLEALGRNGDLWVATADPVGRPHLIAASGWWDGEHIVFATKGTSRTARNLAENEVARLAAGRPDDAIMIDAELEDSVVVGEADPKLAEGFAEAVGWDPREVGEGWVFYRLRPTRIQAFRGYDEVAGSEVMRESRWLA
jgi:Pyridoxamine 5'-phosphate oxidase